MFWQTLFTRVYFCLAKTFGEIDDPSKEEEVLFPKVKKMTSMKIFNSFFLLAMSFVEKIFDEKRIYNYATHVFCVRDGGRRKRERGKEGEGTLSKWVREKKWERYRKGEKDRESKWVSERERDRERERESNKNFWCLWPLSGAAL